MLRSKDARTSPSDPTAVHPTGDRVEDRLSATSSREASPRMFDSDIIDAFSRVPFWVVPLIYVPVIAGSVAYATQIEGLGAAGLAAAFSCGWLAWSLLEYWLHRTLFHWIPDTSWGDRFHFYLHGVHHQWFRDRLRLVMPPAASLAIGLVVIGVLLAFGHLASSIIDDAWVFGVFSGIVFGYLVYDMVHYYVHHHKPTSRVLLALRAHHSKHHHNPAFQEKKFGVSTTLWDHVFGTYT